MPIEIPHPITVEWISENCKVTTTGHDNAAEGTYTYKDIKTSDGERIGLTMVKFQPANDKKNAGKREFLVDGIEDSFITIALALEALNRRRLSAQADAEFGDLQP